MYGTGTVLHYTPINPHPRDLPQSVSNPPDSRDRLELLRYSISFENSRMLSAHSVVLPFGLLLIPPYSSSNPSVPVV